MAGKRDPDLSPKSPEHVSDFLDSETGLPAAPRPGLVLGGCRLEKLIGRGAMGEVYLAEHVALARKVAVKILGPRIAASSRPFARFQREARLAASLDHPNVIRVHHAGLEGGLPFLVMEFVEGESLAERIAREKRLPLPEAIALAEGIARGLAAAHEKGVVHRDVKPANVLIDREGRAKLADFGLAREVLAESPITQPGARLGTPLNMAPEQLEGAEATERSDLYGLGTVIYAMLAGHPPFHGTSVDRVLADIATASPPPLSKLRPSVPPAVDRVVLKLLAKKPGDRFASAEDFLKALRAARGPASRRPRARVLFPLLAALGAALVLLALVLAFARAGDDGAPAGGDRVSAPPAVAEDPGDGGPAEATGSAREVPMPPEWPRGWYTVVASDGIGGPVLPLGDGWSTQGEALSAPAGAGAQRFYLPAEEFYLDLSLESPDGEPGLEIRFGEESYLVRWEDGRRLEWTKLPGGELLYRERSPSVAGEGGPVRFRIAWFSPGVLRIGIGKAVKVCRSDPGAKDIEEHEVSFRPAGSAIRIVSFRIESHERPRR